jgi:hypothetical protein
MNLYRDFMNVVQREWTGELLARMQVPDAIIRLHLLESDLESLRIALTDYLAAKNEVNAAVASLTNDKEEMDNYPSRKVAMSRMFHHAKVFVVCMRRFARLLEAAKSRKHEYPLDVGEKIDLTWKQTKHFFDGYRVARDAIEHIDGEVSGNNRRFINLWGNELEVVDGKRIQITTTALKTAESAWAGIVEVILRPAELRVHTALIKRLLLLLQARIEYMKNLGAAPNQAEKHQARRCSPA